MFLQASVILSTGGRGGPGGSPNSRGVSKFSGGLQIFEGSPNFRGLQVFGGVSKFLGEGLQIFANPPPDTVNERPVRILLECILVFVLLM